MSDWKLYEKLFDIAGLPDDSNPGAVAIQNHLCQLLINRINGDMNLKNTTVLEE